MKRTGLNDSYFVDLINSGNYELNPTFGYIKNVKTNHMISFQSNGFLFFAHFDKKENRNRRIAIHRLMWLVYVGPLNDNEIIIHIDGNKRNNRIDNLEKYQKSRYSYICNGKNIEKQFLKTQGYWLNAISIVNMIRTDYHNNKTTYQKLADKYGISLASTYKIINYATY